MGLEKKAIEIATLSVVTARPEDAILKAAKVMTRGWFRRLPVLEDGRVVGLVTARDVLKAIAEAITPEAGRACIIETLRKPLRSVLHAPPAVVGPYASVKEVLNMVLSTDAGAALVVDEEGRLLGIVTERDLLNALKDSVEVRESVEEIMTRDVKTLRPSDAVYEAVRGMVRGGFRRYPVVDEAGKLVGIVTARDLVALASGREEDVSAADAFFGPVERVMTRNPLTVNPQFGVMAAVRRTTEAGIGVLPVVTAGRLVGIVTEMDLLRAIARHIE